jgi:hypothetical protein
MIDEQFTAAREAEAALLASILIAPETLAEVREKVKPEDFQDARFHDNLHARIYRAMLTTGLPNQVNVAKALDKAGRLQKGDCSYLCTLVAGAIGIDTMEYAGAVLQYSRERQGQLSVEEEEIDQGGAPAVMPAFPEDAWQGLFAAYRDLVAETTEACDAFHYGTFCQIIGCTLSRRLHIYHATKLYPNFYITLIGKSGLTRKDTCMSRARDLLDRLHESQSEQPPFRLVRGIRSYEGLLDELQGEKKTRLIQVGELLSLLAKARQESLSNIIPQLTELYDCPDQVNPPVHQNVITCREPFISILAGTTLSWLQRALTEKDIYGGFANRWMYFCGVPKDPKPNPPRMDRGKRDRLLNDINAVRLWAENVEDSEILISQEANDIFEKYYESYYRRCQNEGIIPTLIVRVQDFIWKLALLYAAMDLSCDILPRHLEPAIAVGDYLEKSTTEVFRSFAYTRGRESEAKVFDYIKSANGFGPVTHRDIYRALNLSAKELDDIIQPMLKLGLLTIVSKKNSRGKETKVYEIP